MPELPDLVYIQKHLTDFLPQKRIVAVDIKEPIILRVALEGGFAELLQDAVFETCYRHGPFLGFTFDKNLELVLHPMLAGRLKAAKKTEKAGRGLSFSLHLHQGWSLHYLDNKKMGKAYLIPQGDYQLVPRYLQQGVDILSEDFTREHFQNLISKQRKQVRVFLMDQTLLSAIGNAYADEILFEAGLHPKTFCNQLSLEERDRLYQSIRDVIKWGIEEVEKARQPIEVKVRDHVRVRNRKDEPCPKCGTTIRRLGVLGYDSFFCPKCQPPKRKMFIEW